jgi:uncharacterized coiled-coil protein SlyX
MALFNSKKRQDPPALTPVEETPAAPAPSPTHTPPAQVTQVSSAPLGAGLRLVSSADAPAAEPVVAAPVEPQEARGESLRGLPLGTILFRQGLVEQQVLEGALAAGMESGERLGEVLIRRELVSEDDIARGLAAQQGLAFLQAEDLAVDAAVASLLSIDDARSLEAVVVRRDDNGLLVITPDPSARQRERLEAQLGESVVEAVVSRGVFDRTIEQLEFPEPAIVVELPVAEAAVESFEQPVDEETFAVVEPQHEVFDEPEIPNPVDEAPEPARHEPEEEPMDQVWHSTDEVQDGEPAPSAAPEPTTAAEMWGEPAAEPAPDFAQSDWNDNGSTNGAVEHFAPEAFAAAEHVEEAAHVEHVAPVAEFASEQFADAPQFDHVEQFDHAEQSWSAEPEAHVSTVEVHIDDLVADHDASVGRIDDLLTRIHEGATSYADLRAQLSGLSESLRTTEETLADRERRLAELAEEHESGQRRIDELLAQLSERDEALSGLSDRVEDLTGRLGSAEERLDERERRLAELDNSLAERARVVEELSVQVEKRDNALSAFEQKLNAIAAQFVDSTS